jgi:hypothetical protein
LHGRNSITASIVSSAFATYTGSFSSSAQTTRRTGSR